VAAMNRATPIGQPFQAIAYGLLCHSLFQRAVTRLCLLVKHYIQVERRLHTGRAALLHTGRSAFYL
jgi:hypothetical protein